MAGEIGRAVVEAGTRAAVDLSLSGGGFAVSLKIDSPWLAGAISIGALSLGAFYLARKVPAGNAIRRGLEGTDNSGVVDPEVRNITDGSILVELHCHTETSFLVFLKDFEKKTVKFRLEEEFKKIGFKDELDVTIRNEEEVYEKAGQIRERSRAPREGEEIAISEHGHLHGKAADGRETTVEAKDTPETILGKRKRKTEKDSDDGHPKEKQGREAEEQLSSLKTQMIDIHIIVENVAQTGGPAKSSPPKSSRKSNPPKSSRKSNSAKSSRKSNPPKSSRKSRTLQFEEEGSPSEHEQGRSIWSAIMSVEGPAENFLSQYLESKLNLIVGSHRIGSLDLRITVECRSLEILKELWEDYCSGHLNQIAKEVLVTVDALEKLGVTDVKLKTFISEEEYEKGKQILKDSPEFPTPTEEDQKLHKAPATKEVGSKCTSTARN